MKNNLRAVIYFRTNNSERLEEKNDIQVKACEEYAKQHNIQIVGTYNDQCVSGITTKGRDGFNQMIEDSSKDLFDMVLVHRIDRFSRSTNDYLEYEYLLNKNNVELMSTTSPLYHSEMNKLIRAIISQASEVNSNETNK